MFGTKSLIRETTSSQYLLHTSGKMAGLSQVATSSSREKTESGENLFVLAFATALR